MYDVLLTRRYLTTRVIPLIAVAAVALCVALVIIVVSVMTGFLDMVKSSGRTLMGDVVVHTSVQGLPHYERLIEEIQKLPEAVASAPTIESFGLLKMPYPFGAQKQTQYVQVWGIDAERLARVTGLADTLYWRPYDADAIDAMGENDFRRFVLEQVGDEGLAYLLDQGSRLPVPEAGSDALPGIILGGHVSRANDRERDGSYSPVRGPDGYWWMPRYDVALTMVPISSAGGVLKPDTVPFKVVNEFFSGVFMIDERRVMIPLEIAQDMLRMSAAPLFDEEGMPTGETDPARTSMILIRSADGVTPDELKVAVEGAYERFLVALEADAEIRKGTIPPPAGAAVQIMTWREMQKEFIDPIEKEREIMRILFSIIYLVCAGLVLAIFWAIVYEKTRDIGILRSVGASRFGIGMIFLRYGAIIGVLGALVGTAIAWVVVRYINDIHDALGEPAPMWTWILAFGLAGLSVFQLIWRLRGERLLPLVMWTLGAIVFGGLGVALFFHRGLMVWDPSVYYFTRIPNALDPVTAGTTMIGAVVFSVLGAFVPAMKAADVDPVRALRYE